MIFLSKLTKIDSSAQNQIYCRGLLKNLDRNINLNALNAVTFKQNLLIKGQKLIKQRDYRNSKIEN